MAAEVVEEAAEIFVVDDQVYLPVQATLLLPENLLQGEEDLAVQMLAYVFPRAAMQLPDDATVRLLQNQVQEDLAVAV